MYQEKHYGVVVPYAEQPVCPKCQASMRVTAIAANDCVEAFWICMNCGHEVSLEEWAANGIASPETVAALVAATEDGLRKSDIATAEMQKARYRCVGGYRWGGGEWGVHEGVERCTGYGGSLEFWQPVTP